MASAAFSSQALSQATSAQENICTAVVHLDRASLCGIALVIRCCGDYLVDKLYPSPCCPVSLPTIALVAEQVEPGTCTCSRTCWLLVVLFDLVDTTEDFDRIGGVWLPPPRERSRSRDREPGANRVLLLEPHPEPQVRKPVQPEEEPEPEREDSRSSRETPRGNHSEGGSCSSSTARSSQG